MHTNKLQIHSYVYELEEKKKKNLKHIHATLKFSQTQIHDVI